MRVHHVVRSRPIGQGVASNSKVLKGRAHTSTMSSKRIKSASNGTTPSLLVTSGQYHQTELDKTRQEAVAMKSKIRSVSQGVNECINIKF